VRLGQLLFSQGFGTRQICHRIVSAGRLSIAGRIESDPEREVALAEGEPFEVDGASWPFHARAVIVLHKPAGFECSAAPRDHPAVLSLLPAPLLARGVQPVGRLDVDTTGVLLLTDDGALLHRLTSPKRRVEKLYDVTVRHPLDDRQLDALVSGVVLHDDPEPVRALRAEATGPRTLQLALDSGKYHQVKRMLGAVGNRVEALDRTSFAGMTVDGLAAGAWRWLTADEQTRLG
jgi:16S rRNA pseudouridine516 synthase